MTKFTPGPWHVTEARGLEGEHLYWEISGDSHKYRGYLATLQHSEGIGGTTRDENDANALLVSAAPEMYMALERLARVASVELTGKRDDVLEQAQSALAKARGEE